jgi:hypothetical protein
MNHKIGCKRSLRSRFRPFFCLVTICLSYGAIGSNHILLAQSTPQVTETEWKQAYISTQAKLKRAKQTRLTGIVIFAAGAGVAAYGMKAKKVETPSLDTCHFGPPPPGGTCQIISASVDHQFSSARFTSGLAGSVLGGIIAEIGSQHIRREDAQLKQLDSTGRERGWRITLKPSPAVGVQFSW